MTAQQCIERVVDSTWRSSDDIVRASIALGYERGQAGITNLLAAGVRTGELEAERIPGGNRKRYRRTLKPAVRP